MEEDQGHFEHGLGVLDTLNPAEADAHDRNLQQTAYLYNQMLEHIRNVAR